MGGVSNAAARRWWLMRAAPANLVSGSLPMKTKYET